jgi:predicted small secreted protein
LPLHGDVADVEISTMRKLVASALVLGLMMTAACNTVRGAGEDVQSAGQAVENAAS